MKNNAATPGRHVENGGDPDHTEALTQVGPGTLRHIQINNSSKKIILLKENGGDSDYNDALIQVGPAGMGIAETLHYADNLR